MGNKLKVIWQVLTKNDWIVVRYEVKDKIGLPFDLYLPQGFVATYQETQVIVKRVNRPIDYDKGFRMRADGSL